jgi:hypothetical protein
MTGDNRQPYIIQKTTYLYLHFNTKTVREYICEVTGKLLESLKKN